jgi:hypothetical protein
VEVVVDHIWKFGRETVKEILPEPGTVETLTVG